MSILNFDKDTFQRIMNEKAASVIEESKQAIASNLLMTETKFDMEDVVNELETIKEGYTLMGHATHSNGKSYKVWRHGSDYGKYVLEPKNGKAINHSGSLKSLKNKGFNFIKLLNRKQTSWKNVLDESSSLDIKHGAFHRWLGKPENEPITHADIEKGLKAGGHPAKMANFARNFSH